MPPKIERTELCSMKSGQAGDFFAVLCEKTLRSTRDGKPYFSLRFRDRSRSASTPVWENSPLFASCENEWAVGQHFKIRATFTEHPKYGAQLELMNIRLAGTEDRLDGYDPAAFTQATRFDVDALFAEIVEAADSIQDGPLRELVRTLLLENEEAIRRHPAASRNHHAYQGGYLEHTVSVVRTGIYLAEKYRDYYPELEPPLNRDLVVAGCILHDIGKIHELSCGLEETTFTVAGQLVGHILIGRDMIRDGARAIEGLNPELLLYLDHIITSHQGSPEWGSPKVPMIPEALLVHAADDLDAKMNMFVLALKSSEGDDPFTEHSHSLRRRLLRRRNV